MSSDSTNNSIGFFGLLGIAFIVLKLCHVITWSWWLVLLPIYIPGAVLGGFLLAIFVIWAIVMTREFINDKFERGE